MTALLYSLFGLAGYYLHKLDAGSTPSAGFAFVQFMGTVLLIVIAMLWKYFGG